MLDETKYTDIADLILNLKSWNKIADAESIGAGTFLMITHTVYDNRAIYLKQKTITQDQAVEIIRAAKSKMMTHFKRTNLQLGDIQKLVRGNVVLPLPGLPDVLAPMYSLPYKDGMYKGNQGDAYIEMVRFTKNGPIIESLNVYGASARKDSPHYTDQMEMYVKQQTKKMTLDKATIYQEAVKKYNPL
jgi:acyl-homoserine-lactone acylase